MRQVPKKTIQLFAKKKLASEAITMITCYDYACAQIAAHTDIDALLVGDSVAMVVHGHDSTVHADMTMMQLHTQAVARGVGSQFVVADLPFLAHHQSRADAIRQCGVLIRAGAQAVKIEGADVHTCAQIKAITEAGIPIMGHIGLTPQSVNALGGYRVQGKLASAAERIFQQAQALEDAGCFAVVLECIPEALASRISQQLSIATIGIGAGRHTDGQILVWHDILGMQDNISPKFVQKYLDAKTLMIEALNAHAKAITTRAFPSQAHCY